jgi:hypothetical protein
VLLDSFCDNEIGDPEDVVAVSTPGMRSLLADWRSTKSNLNVSGRPGVHGALLDAAAGAEPDVRHHAHALRHSNRHRARPHSALKVLLLLLLLLSSSFPDLFAAAFLLLCVRMTFSTTLTCTCEL